MLVKLLSNMLYWLSGEWLLRNRANSGGVVFARALIVGLLTFSLAIGVLSWLDSILGFGFSKVVLATLVRQNLVWFGAIFGGAYAALYSRFSSQWQYLADLYNQLMQAEDARPRSELKGEQRKRRVLWWHAFIADAKDLHLALKPTFAAALLALLKEDDIATFARGKTEEDRKTFDNFSMQLRRVVGEAPTPLAVKGETTESSDAGP